MVTCTGADRSEGGVGGGLGCFFLSGFLSNFAVFHSISDRYSSPSYSRVDFGEPFRRPSEKSGGTPGRARHLAIARSKTL